MPGLIIEDTGLSDGSGLSFIPGLGGPGLTTVSDYGAMISFAGSGSLSALATVLKFGTAALAGSGGLSANATVSP